MQLFSLNDIYKQFTDLLSNYIKSDYSFDKKYCVCTPTTTVIHLKDKSERSVICTLLFINNMIALRVIELVSHQLMNAYDSVFYYVKRKDGKSYYTTDDEDTQLENEHMTFYENLDDYISKASLTNKDNVNKDKYSYEDNNVTKDNVTKDKHSYEDTNVNKDKHSYDDLETILKVIFGL